MSKSRAISLIKEPLHSYKVFSLWETKEQADPQILECWSKKNFILHPWNSTWRAHNLCPLGLFANIPSVNSARWRSCTSMEFALQQPRLFEKQFNKQRKFTVSIDFLTWGAHAHSIISHSPEVPPLSGLLIHKSWTALFFSPPNYFFPFQECSSW